MKEVVKLEYYNDYYNEALEADLSLMEVGTFVRDKIINFAGKKLAEAAWNTITNPPGTTVVVYNNDNYLKLMCRPVDNTKMTYEEFQANRSKLDLDFSISIDHTNNPNTIGGKIGKLFTDIFIK